MIREQSIAALQIQELEAQRIKLAGDVHNICAGYGLSGSIIFYHPSPIQGSHRNKVYLIASRNPDIIAGKVPFDPEYYLRRNKRSDRLIYTDVFVYDLVSNTNRLDALEKLVEYCKNTEFLTTLYGRFNLPPPDKLRRFELRQLMDIRNLQHSEPTGSIWKEATDALNDFFAKERKSGKTKEWLNFFRSDQFPDDAGTLDKLRAFRNRHCQKVSLEQLMACNSCICTLEMQEHEYRRFADFMQHMYPDVPYSVSKKIVIDNGTKSIPDDMDLNYNRRVTGEEYNRILEQTFAQDGGVAVGSLHPTYFEVRKVSYTAVDEPYVASAFNDATLRYARRDELTKIRGRGGELRMCAIPKDDFMSFVSLAKANALPFYIDNLGTFETPSLEFVTTIYSSRDDLLIQSILTRIVEEKVDSSHLAPEDERSMLQDVLIQATYPRAIISDAVTNNNLLRKDAVEYESKKDRPLDL